MHAASQSKHSRLHRARVRPCATFNEGDQSVSEQEDVSRQAPFGGGSNDGEATNDTEEKDGGVTTNDENEYGHR